jgi:hypothetical protein
MRKKEAEFVAATALIVAAVLLLVSLPLLSSDEPSPPPSCARQTAAWSLANSTISDISSPYLVPVLLMQPNTTGYICVTYQSTGDDPLVYGSPINYFHISRGDCNVNGACSFRPSYSFKIGITILNSTLPFVGNATFHYESVMYSVTALSNSTGFYSQAAPFEYCNDMPLAVGYSASQLNASDFPGFSNLLMCMRMSYQPIAVGVIGMQVTHVKFPGH